METIKKTLRGKGYLAFINEIRRSKGSVVVNEFLNEVAVNFAKFSSDYMKIVNESPFAYRERQVNSVFAPALSKVADAFFMEVPTSRIDKDLDYNSHGWIDYWAFYRNLDFYLELKHSYASYLGGSITQTSKRRWLNANRQTRDCLSHISKSYKSNGIVALPIHIIPIYKVVNDKIDDSFSHQDGELEEIYFGHHNGLEPKPNWSCLWTLPEPIINNCWHKSNRDNKEYYPGVMMFSNMDVVIDQ